MSIFRSPKTLTDAYGLTVFLLITGGLFPYRYDVVTNKYYMSWKRFSYTLLHLAIYTYVNITSILESWRDFSQPMIGNSSLTALGNLVLRLLGIVITFVIIAPFLIGSIKEVSTINDYLYLMEEFTSLGIDVTIIYRRIYRMSALAVFIFLTLLGFTAWHSIYFYERITHKPPELKFYLVATLSTFYQLLYMFYAFTQYYGLFAFTSQLNIYLEDLRDKYQEIYENERSMKFQWMSNNINTF